MELQNTLTAYEQERFTECQNKVASGLQTCFEVGAALTEIRDKRLYREDFNTFEEYTQTRFQIGSSHTYRLIEAAEIKASPIGENISNEAQARAIAAVPEEAREEVMAQVVESGPVTAAAITEVAATKDDGIERDQNGLEVPANVRPLWDKAYSESRDMLFAYSSLRNKFKKAVKEKDSIFCEISHSENIGLLNTLYANAKLIAPYALCSKCKGEQDLGWSNCDLCHARGFLSQFAWKMFGNV